MNLDFEITRVDCISDLSMYENDQLVMSSFTENTMLVSFDIKLSRRDQKQHRNGETCRASPTCF